MALMISDQRRRARSTVTGSRPRVRCAGLMLAAAVATASVGAAAGCSAEPESVVFPHPPSDTDAPLRAGAAPTPTVDPAVAAAIEEILIAYEGAVQASMTAHRAGDPDHPHLDRHLAGEARRQVRLAIRNTVDDHLYHDGELRIVEATVTAIDLDSSPPTATLEACVDNTDYRLVDRDTGEPPPGMDHQGGRRLERMQVDRFAHGRWMIAAYLPAGEPC